MAVDRIAQQPDPCLGRPSQPLDPLEEQESEQETITEVEETIPVPEEVIQEEVEGIDESNPVLSTTHQAILDMCKDKKLTFAEIGAELSIQERPNSSTTVGHLVSDLIEWGLLFRPDGPNSRKGVTQVKNNKT